MSFHGVLSAVAVLLLAVVPSGIASAQVTWNPADKGVNVALSSANTVAAGSGNVFHTVRATLSRNSGKRCFETVFTAVDAGASITIGIAPASVPVSGVVGYAAPSASVQWIASPALQQPVVAGVTRANGFAVTAGSVVGDVTTICIDFASGSAWWARNGAWAGNPGAGIAPNVTSITGAWFPAVSTFNAANAVRLRAASAELQFAPAGFLAWGDDGQPPPSAPPMVSAPSWTKSTTVTQYRRTPVGPLIERVDVRNYMRVVDAETANSTRASVLAYIYPQGRTPAPLASESWTVPSIAGLAGAERWTVSMPNSLPSRVFFLTSTGPAPSDSCLFVYHAGHEVGAMYDDPQVRIMAAEILGRGCDLALVAMPLMGVNEVPGLVHNSLAAYDTATFSSFLYFVEPVIRTLDEALARKAYARIGMSGLSGGGWTTAIVGAVEQRFTAIYPVGGSMPLELDMDPALVGGINVSSKRGDYEQSHPPFYARASYFDLYAMGAQGRRAVHFYMAYDSCCFPAWAAAAFADQMENIARNEVGGTLIFREDTTAPFHQLSAWASRTIADDFMRSPASQSMLGLMAAPVKMKSKPRKRKQEKSLCLGTFCLQ